MISRMVGFTRIIKNVAKYSSAAKTRMTSEQFLKELERFDGKDESQKALLLNAYDALSKDVEDLNDKYRRSLAETENVRRRGQKQVEDAKVFAVQSFRKGLLEVADKLDLSIGAVKPESIQKSDEVKSLHDGVTMRAVFLKIFEKHGLVEVTPNGEKFDPNLHEAVFQSSKDQASAQPGHIKQDRKSTEYHDRNAFIHSLAIFLVAVIALIRIHSDNVYLSSH